MAEWALRDYTIKDGVFDEWLKAWREGVLPIRQQYGFQVQAWAVPEDSRFVWVLRYDGPGTYDDADKAYRTSPERAALDPEPADFIAEMRVTRLTPVLTDGELHDVP